MTLRQFNRVSRCAAFDGWVYTLLRANGCIRPAFKTDTDISKTGGRRERELQAWQPDSADANGAAAPGAPPPANARNVDELTFGPGASGGSWDQFAVNEKLFGVKAGFDEDAYTTKLDRSAPDYKEKEKRAQALANEIMSVSASHVSLGGHGLIGSRSRLPTMFISPRSVS